MHTLTLACCSLALASVIGSVLLSMYVHESTGACCRDDGRCERVLASACSGVFAGVSTSCHDVDCRRVPAPTPSVGPGGTFAPTPLPPVATPFGTPAPSPAPTRAPTRAPTPTPTTTGPPRGQCCTANACIALIEESACATFSSTYTFSTSQTCAQLCPGANASQPCCQLGDVSRLSCSISLTTCSGRSFGPSSACNEATGACSVLPTPVPTLAPTPVPPTRAPTNAPTPFPTAVPPPTVPGACCLPSGCVDGRCELSCVQQVGQFGGEGSLCTKPGFCGNPQLVGGCCSDETNACQAGFTQLACTSQGAYTWGGPGSTCATAGFCGNPPPMGMFACCCNDAGQPQNVFKCFDIDSTTFETCTERCESDGDTYNSHSTSETCSDNTPSCPVN